MLWFSSKTDVTLVAGRTAGGKYIQSGVTGEVNCSRDAFQQQ